MKTTKTSRAELRRYLDEGGHTIEIQAVRDLLDDIDEIREGLAEIAQDLAKRLREHHEGGREK
jgi:hypothetical protein